MNRKFLLSIVLAAATLSAHADGDDWLHTDGRRIMDEHNQEVKLTGANWFGFNCTERVFHGLWQQDMETILKSCAEHGINVMRVPVATELLKMWKDGTESGDININTSNGMNSWYQRGKTTSHQIFDLFLSMCKKYGIKVFIDIHSPELNNSGHNYAVWYKPEFDTDCWINSLAWFAEQYKNDDTVIGIDLKNEPHGKFSQGDNPRAKWDNSKDENNWRYAASRCGKAILEKNPHLLIFVEGIEQTPRPGYTYESGTENQWDPNYKPKYYGAWWGGNLRRAGEMPVDLGKYQSQLVYSPHDYGPKVYAQKWFDKDFTEKTLLDDYWYYSWYYLHQENIAPLLIGEWGGFMDGSSNEKYLRIMASFIERNNLSHTFWCVNPDSGDTGGLLENDWLTWDTAKYDMMKGTLWHDKNGKYVSLDHKVSLPGGTNVTEFYKNGNTISYDDSTQYTPQAPDTGDASSGDTGNTGDSGNTGTGNSGSTVSVVQGDDWLHAKGAGLYDKDGHQVYLTGANWFGFNCTERVFHGLWSINMKNVLKLCADKGINILRVPISTQLLLEWKKGEYKDVNVNWNANQDLKNADGTNMNSKQIFDKFLDYCKLYGIKVMMDLHSDEANNSGHMYPLWYGQGGITTDQWIEGWVWFVKTYKNDDTIIACDLKNEPHGTAKWDNSTDENNWQYAASRCGQAILKENPNLLIMVEGIESIDGHGAWWGANLRNAEKYPIDLGQYQSQLVYSPHEYGPGVSDQPWFQKDFTEESIYNDYWCDTWFYLQEKNIAPLLIGEWGGKLDGGSNQKYLGIINDFITKNHINHTYWCINPNSGDTGGLLKDDWTTWDDAKWNMMKSSLWQTSNGTFIGLDHVVKLGSKGTNVTAFYGVSTGMSTTTAAKPSKVVAIYNVCGARTDKYSHGVNIVKFQDGTVKKIIVNK